MMKAPLNKFFRFLLLLYPESFRSHVGDSMMQAVVDSLVGSSVIEKLNIAGNLFAGAAIENGKAICTKLMSEPTSNKTRQLLIGFLLVVPGIVMISLLVLGINPPLGPFEPYFSIDNPFGKWNALAVVFGTVLVLPIVGVWIANGGGSKPSFGMFLVSAAAGLLLVLPLVALQLIYGRLTYSCFPVVLFAILWILPTVAIYVAAPLFARLRRNEYPRPDPLSVALRLVALMPVAIMWFALIKDQMPCFLGVPNCD